VENYGGVTNKNGVIVRVKALTSGIYDCLNNTDDLILK
jgi:hypothetical protein